MDNSLLIAIVGIFIPSIIAILVAAFSYYFNEKSKRRFEEYKRKEDRYHALIRNLQGFKSPIEEEKITEFLDQANLCWLYCPDEVIYKLNAFLDAFNVNEDIRSKQEKRMKISEKG
ncbi:MAG: hypothetical protein FJ150_09035 [Euryarchaeota archaeon]|nr:hypothetical protein [Euryarchaeota archaeon]